MRWPTRPTAKDEDHPQAARPVRLPDHQAHCRLVWAEGNVPHGEQAETCRGGLGPTGEAVPDWLAYLLPIIGVPDRIRLLRLVARTRFRVSETAPELGITDASVYRHLTLMRMAGLIAPMRQCRRVDHTLTELGAVVLQAINALDEAIGD